MKKHIEFLGILMMLIFLSSSCNDILEQEAVDSISEEVVFKDVNLAKAYLGNCFKYIGGNSNGSLGGRISLLSSVTDESYSVRAGSYQFIMGLLSPDNMGNFGNREYSYLNWASLYDNIRRTNNFIAQIDNVPVSTSADEALKESLKGTAYFIRAYNYGQLMLGYGGVVLLDSPLSLGDDFLSANRSSLKETRDFILSDIQKALDYLPLTRGNSDRGYPTKAAAAALKSRLLLFCASDLVNGGYQASNDLVSFTDGNQGQRWQDAKNATEDLMNGTYGSFALHGTITDPPSPMTAEDIKSYSDNYASIFLQNGSWNEETIWGIQNSNLPNKNIVWDLWRPNLWNAPNGWHCWGTNNSPTEETIRTYFEMADGTPFVWDRYNPGNNVKRTATAQELAADPNRSPFNGREPRFYASVFCNGDKFQPRPTDLASLDPVGVIQSGYFVNQDGSITPGLDTRETTVESWNGTETGYYFRKFVDDNVVGQFNANEALWVEFRYAEVLLNYAEACIELGGSDLQNGINALNMVRNRAGLPDRITNNQNEAREYIRHERSTEFYAEGHRWYDIRRWMIAPDVIKDVHKLDVYEYWDGRWEWIYNTSRTVNSRSWDDKCYWLPIPRDEINRAPQLTQNPQYN